MSEDFKYPFSIQTALGQNRAWFFLTFFSSPYSRGTVLAPKVFRNIIVLEKITNSLRILNTYHHLSSYEGKEYLINMLLIHGVEMPYFVALIYSLNGSGNSYGNLSIKLLFGQYIVFISLDRHTRQYNPAQVFM